MALQILKPILVLCAVFVPIFGAKLIFMRQMNEWFSLKETSYFSFGFPVTKEGYMLSGTLIFIVITLLIIINNYV